MADHWSAIQFLLFSKSKRSIQTGTAINKTDGINYSICEHVNPTGVSDAPEFHQRK